MAVDGATASTLLLTTLGEIETQVNPDAKIGEALLIVEVIRPDGSKGIRVNHTGSTFTGLGLLRMAEAILLKTP